MSNTSTILSFDVSSVSTGWAFLFHGKLQEFGTIEPPSSFRIQEKLHYFDKVISGLLKIFHPDYILIEETYLKNVKTLKTLMQFIGIVNYRCFTVLYEEPIFISPQTVRSHFGLKNKQEVFDYIKDKYKSKFKNFTFETGNDITDATLQALYWWYVLGEKLE